MTAPIPLLQYWHDGDPPPGVRRRLAGWADDPDFEVEVFDDRTAREFLKEHFDQTVVRAFDNCAVPAMRADYFRYAALYIRGGAYIDADVKNLGGAGPIFRATDRGCLFVRQLDKPPKSAGWRPGRMPNGFMYVRHPQDPAFAYALEQATENVTRQISNDVWEVTGPGIFTAVWGEGGERSESFFDGFTIHSFEDVAEKVAMFGHMKFKNRDTYWQKYRDPSHGSIYRTAGLVPDPDELLLPPGSRLLHIGPHKTGSTALQASLKQARRRLAARDVRYIGIDRARRAAWSIGVRGAPGSMRRPPEGVWHRLVADVQQAADQRVCISNEDFGRAEPEQIRRIVNGLGGSEPHVVAVVRPLDKLLPSLWQQRVKVGSPLTYDDWLRAVLARPGEPCAWDDTATWQHTERTNVWYAHDTASAVLRWSEVVGRDRVTLIVSDGNDRGLLPRTFERLLGLPEGLLTLQPGASNESLPWCDVEFVRAINEALIAREVPARTRRRLVARGLVPDLMSREAANEQRRTPPLPEWAATTVKELSETRADAIHELGVRVVGDPETVRVSEVATGDPNEPPAIPGAAAARAVDWLIAELLSEPPSLSAERPGRPSGDSLLRRLVRRVR